MGFGTCGVLGLKVSAGTLMQSQASFRRHSRASSRSWMRAARRFASSVAFGLRPAVSSTTRGSETAARVGPDTIGAERNIVIGSDLAQRLWGNASPIGRRLAAHLHPRA